MMHGRGLMYGYVRGARGNSRPYRDICRVRFGASTDCQCASRSHGKIWIAN
jgi:hypothetical protein